MAGTTGLGDWVPSESCHRGANSKTVDELKIIANNCRRKFHGSMNEREAVRWGLIFVGKLPHKNLNPRKFVHMKN